MIVLVLMLLGIEKMRKNTIKSSIWTIWISNTTSISGWRQCLSIIGRMGSIKTEWHFSRQQVLSHHTSMFYQANQIQSSRHWPLTPSALIYDEWFDAANPYGKTINAFLVVEGWNITLLLRLIGIGVLLTICAVSVVTAACHSIEIGLTAGSYAVGLLAVFLAIFTFLSAII